VSSVYSWIQGYIAQWGCTSDNDCERLPCEVGTCNNGACSYELDPSATTTPVSVKIKTDRYPGETSWDISYDNKAIYLGSGYNRQFTVYRHNHDLCEGTYKYCISDSYGDGICCSNGNGYYTVTVNDNVVATGGDFGDSDCTDFTVSTGPTAPTPTAPSPVAVPTIPTAPSPVAVPTKKATAAPTKKTTKRTRD